MTANIDEITSSARGKTMKKIIFFLTLLSMISLSYAESTLTVNNRAKDINVEITTDLLCGSDAFAVRYTRPLDENPILTNKPQTASWKNCVIAEQGHLVGSDHSKIYVKLVDLKTGDFFQTVIHANSGNFSKTISFLDKHYVISMTYAPNYQYINHFPGGTTRDLIDSSSTISVDG